MISSMLEFVSKMCPEPFVLTWTECLKMLLEEYFNLGNDCAKYLCTKIFAGAVNVESQREKFWQARQLKNWTASGEKSPIK